MLAARGHALPAILVDMNGVHVADWHHRMEVLQLRIRDVPAQRCSRLHFDNFDCPGESWELMRTRRNQLNPDDFQPIWFELKFNSQIYFHDLKFF